MTLVSGFVLPGYGMMVVVEYIKFLLKSWEVVYERISHLVISLQCSVSSNSDTLSLTFLEMVSSRPLKDYTFRVQMFR